MIEYMPGFVFPDQNDAGFDLQVAARKKALYAYGRFRLFGIPRHFTTRLAPSSLDCLLS
jgi:hypothetical protein